MLETKQASLLAFFKPSSPAITEDECRPSTPKQTGGEGDYLEGLEILTYSHVSLNYTISDSVGR